MQRLSNVLIHLKVTELFCVCLCVCVFLAHLSRRLIGELIVYPWSGGQRPSASVIDHNAQTSSSQKPLGRSKPNFMWSLLWYGEQSLFAASGSRDQDGHYAHGKKLFKYLLLQNQRADFHETWYVASVDCSETIAVSDLKVSWSRHLIEYMKVCEY